MQIEIERQKLHKERHFGMWIIRQRISMWKTKEIFSAPGAGTEDTRKGGGQSMDVRIGYNFGHIIGSK